MTICSPGSSLGTGSGASGPSLTSTVTKWQLAPVMLHVSGGKHRAERRMAGDARTRNSNSPRVLDEHGRHGTHAHAWPGVARLLVQLAERGSRGRLVLVDQAGGELC